MRIRQARASAPGVAQTRVTDDQVQEALSWLHPMLLTSLRNLSSAPADVVDAAIQLLPVASKIALRQNGLVVYTDDSDEACPSNERPLQLTPLGEAVIAAAPVELTAVADWPKRTAAALDASRASEPSHA